MRLLTMEAAAEMMSVSLNTLRSLLPKLGAVDLRGGNGKNRMIRIPEASIMAYLEGCVIKAPVSQKELKEMQKEKKPMKLKRRKE